ncbi:hypothetical protein Pcinc_020950 [Petrolisthes cinctipes]|uniref:Uncharacterized protein n=1 Tax=Petrolisthes cinctipes TaxID=88211 RepID=A0AAE1FGT3_PETCI|nr:hypothetical protein Pcinc_020950 [Petrolisthes cinctipes]
MGLNCHYMTKPKPHRKRLEMEILLDDIHQLEKNGKITTSTALQPTLLAEAAKTRGVYHSKLLTAINLPINVLTNLQAPPPPKTSLNRQKEQEEDHAQDAVSTSASPPAAPVEPEKDAAPPPVYL